MSAQSVASAVVLEAAALAEKGALDPETAECAHCGLILAVHDDAEAGHGHEASEAWRLAAAALGSQDRAIMDDIVDDLDADYRPSGKRGPRVSDAGSCRREVYYRENPPAGYVPRTDIDRRRAALGSLIHKAAETARAKRYPWKLFEMELTIPGLDKPGRVDEYDPVLGEVADTKSAGRAKWAMVGGDGVPEEAWEQVAIYGYALAMLDLPVRTLKVVAVNRDTGAEEPFYRDFDLAFGLAALDKLIATGTMIDAGVVPPRDGYGPAHWMCQWCPALNHCWNVDAAAAAGRSPESYTLLGPTPDDPSIVWAGKEFLEASAKRLEWEKREKRAKALLQGLKPRTYGADREDGGVEIADSWSTSVAYKEAYEQLLALYALPEDKRPAPDALPEPRTTRKKSQTAKKPGGRAATKVKRPAKKTPAEQATEQVSAATASFHQDRESPR